MPRDVYELQEIGVVALLKQGKPKDATVTFVFLKDDAELERKTGEISTEARTGKAATTKYTPPAVADDKPSYKLTFFVIVDGEEFHNADEIMVWPQKGKLKSIKDESTEANLPGFKFKVMQGGAQFGPAYKTKPDTSDVEFKLQKGLPFTIEHVEPWEKKSQEAVKLRDLKAKVVLNFTAEFVKPLRPNTGEIKQWVNLASTEDGQDGKGHEVVIKIRAQGDDARTEKIGQAGVFAFVKVKFSGATSAAGNAKKKSKRNLPKPELVAGKNLSDLVTVTDGVEYTGKVELAAAGGTGEFSVCVGKAGGDLCEISIGGANTCADATLKLINWRKLWYELMAPSTLNGTEERVVDTARLLDFNASGRGNLKKSGDETFIEYELYKSCSFTEEEGRTTCVGAILPRAFFDVTTGPANVYLLTDYTFKLYPKAFDKGKGAQELCIKACNFNLYSDGPGTDDPVTLTTSPHATTASARLSTGTNKWSPISAYGEGGGARTVQEISWEAVIDPNAIKARPTVEIVADVEASGQDRALLRITEKNQNLSQDVTFDATAVPGSERTKIDNFIPTITTYAALKTHGNKLKFEVSVPKNKPVCELAADVERSGQGRSVLRVRETTQNTHTDLSFDGNAVPGSERQKLDDLIRRVCTADLMRGQANKVKFEVAIPKNKPVQTVAEIDGPRGDETKTASIRITETNRNRTHDVAFAKDGFHVGTAVTPGEATRIETFVTELCRADNLRGAGNKIDITVAGPTNNDRRIQRRGAVKTVVEQKLAALATEVAYHAGLAALKNDIPARVTAVAPEVAHHPGLAALKNELTGRVAAVAPEQAFHPGLDDTGAVQKATVSGAGVDALLDIANSTWSTIAVTLPPVPAGFVGPASDTKCPVMVKVKYEPQHSGNGLSGQGLQAGEILVTFAKGDCPLSITDTVLHEFGHSFAMAPYNTATDAFAPGLRRPKSTTQEEDVVDYRTNGTKGHYYDRHGHSGSHCLYGASNAQKQSGHTANNYRGMGGGCILYGEGPRDDSRRTRLAFCPQCEDYMRARAL